jgi:hypothetical protein
MFDANGSWTPGMRIGAYALVALLGHGGSGEVWKARAPIRDTSIAPACDAAGNCW